MSPVLHGNFLPSFPLTEAEKRIDWISHANHIVERRERIEKGLAVLIRRLAFSFAEFFAVSQQAHQDFTARLEFLLYQTAQFGYQQVRRELKAAETVTAALVEPEAGESPRTARQGLLGIRSLLRRRSFTVASAVAAALGDADKTQTQGLTPFEREVLLAEVARKVVHNHVLELVGETLNLGRTAGALSLARPPEFALRSEQLDKRTCDACTRLHGQIVQVDSADYYAILPPTGCLGGGRCRGLMVFGYGPEDMRSPLLEAA